MEKGAGMFLPRLCGGACRLSDDVDTRVKRFLYLRLRTDATYGKR